MMVCKIRVKRKLSRKVLKIETDPRAIEILVGLEMSMGITQDNEASQIRQFKHTRKKKLLYRSFLGCFI